MTNQLLSSFLIILFSFCYLSCNDDDNTDVYINSSDSGNYDCISDSKEFFNDGKNIFSYTCKDEWIEFFFDIVGDESDQVGGFWPDIDAYRIYVDVDNNGLLDERVDFKISRSNGGNFCKFYLLSPVSETPCIRIDHFIEELNFSETANSPASHFNIELTLPKYELSSSSQVGLFIEIHDPQTGWQRYPSSQELFAETFKIDL